jgi:beta-phosphoglucomutase-like phosphatase (HAD superfamily)
VTSGTYQIFLSYPLFPHSHIFPAIPPTKNTEHDEKKNLATNVYTPQALSRTGIPVPAAGYVTADDVERGKPEPEPYLAGAARVGADPKNCTSTYY